MGRATKFNGVADLGASAGTRRSRSAPNAGETLDDHDDRPSPTVDGGDSTDAADATPRSAAIDTALDTITGDRATFGAAQNRFEYAISQPAVAAENQAAARGRIMDADFAAETANLSRAQILQQAGIAMVAQANALPQSVLTLLR